VALVDTTTNKITATIPLDYAYTTAAHNDPVHGHWVPAQDTTVKQGTTAVLISRNGKLLYASTNYASGGPQFVIDTTTNPAQVSTILSRPFERIPDVSYPRNIAFSPDSGTAFSANSVFLKSMKSDTYATTDQSVLDQMHGETWPLAVSTDGRQIYVIGRTDKLQGYLRAIQLA
jgi:hypothetical protein